MRTSRLRAIRLTARYLISRTVATLVANGYLRIRVEGRERYPRGPAVICLNHQNWADPFILMACVPWRPRLYFFGPKEEDMRVGGRNRLMSWVGTAVPYRPGKNDLLDATRRVQRVFEAGGVLAIFGEGRIHAGESVLLPLQEGPAFFALRSRVPLVPVAMNGTSWLGFGRTIRLRIGVPIEAEGRPTRETVEALTGRVERDLRELTSGYPDQSEPGPFGRWLTELFNEWLEGTRELAEEAQRRGEAVGRGYSVK